MRPMDFKSACQRLINLANERGGEDNITVVIAQFSGSGLAVPESDRDGAAEPGPLAGHADRDQLGERRERLTS